MPFGAPTLWPASERASTPRASSERGSHPAACTASVCMSAPDAWAMAASSAMGCTVPISLFASCTDTSVVSGRTARSSASGCTRPPGSTSTSVISKPCTRARWSAEASTASCSIGEMTTCLPRGFASARPLTARLSASVPPLVKTTSPGRQPTTAATAARAAESARAASSPRPWLLDGLPNDPDRNGHIASSASRRTGVVAAWSRKITDAPGERPTRLVGMPRRRRRARGRASSPSASARRPR